jgi:hypothetical protein
LANLETAIQTLGGEAPKTKAGSWSKFINDLNGYLPDPQLQTQQDKLRTAAALYLKKAGFGQLSIIGVNDENKVVERRGSKIYTIDASGTESPETKSIERDGKGRIIFCGSNYFAYSGDSRQPSSISWYLDLDSESTWRKKGGAWVEKHPQSDSRVNFKHTPRLDQQTGKLTYQRADYAGCKQYVAVEYPNGSVIAIDDNGKVMSLTDAEGNSRTLFYGGNGNLTEVKYESSSGKIDPEKTWTYVRDHWENGKKPPEIRKEVGVDDKHNYYEVKMDGKKTTYYTYGAEDPEKGYLITIPRGGTMWAVGRESLIRKHEDPKAPGFDTKVVGEVIRLVKRNVYIFGDQRGRSPEEIFEGLAGNVGTGTEVDISPDEPAGANGKAHR